MADTTKDIWNDNDGEDEEKKPRRRNNHRRYRKPKANPDTPKD